MLRIMLNSSCDNRFSCIGMNANPNPADASWRVGILPPVSVQLIFSLLHPSALNVWEVTHLNKDKPLDFTTRSVFLQMLTLYIWSKIRRIKKKILKTYWKLCPGPKIRNVTNVTTLSLLHWSVTIHQLSEECVFVVWPWILFSIGIHSLTSCCQWLQMHEQMVMQLMQIFLPCFPSRKAALTTLNHYGLERYPQRLSSWKYDWHSLVLLGEWRRHAVRTGFWDHSSLFWWAGFSWGKAFLPLAFRAAGSKARESSRNEDKPYLLFSTTHIPQVFCSMSGHQHALLY